MKKYVISLFIVLLLIPNVMFAKSSILDSVAIISDYAGESKIQPGNSKKWKNVSVNMPVYEGASFKTGKDSFIEVTFDDASIIRLDDNSKLTLDELKREKGVSRTIFKLTIGKLMAVVDKLLNDESSFEVHSKFAVAAVKGTEFAVEATEKTAYAATYEGSIVFGDGQKGARPPAKKEQKSSKDSAIKGKKIAENSKEKKISDVKIYPGKESKVDGKGKQPSEPAEIKRLKGLRTKLDKMRKEAETVRYLKKHSPEDLKKFREDKVKEKEGKMKGSLDKAHRMMMGRKTRMKKMARQTMRKQRRNAMKDMKFMNDEMKADRVNGMVNVDIHGNRIRVEDYVVRTRFIEKIDTIEVPRESVKFVSITLRENTKDMSMIDNVFNRYLPENIPVSAWKDSWLIKPSYYRIKTNTVYSNMRDNVTYQQEYWLDPPGDNGGLGVDPVTRIGDADPWDSVYNIAESMRKLTVNDVIFEYEVLPPAYYTQTYPWDMMYTQISSTEQGAIQDIDYELGWYSKRINFNGDYLTIKLYLFDDESGKIKLSDHKYYPDWSDLLQNTSVEMIFESNLFTNKDHSIDVVSKTLWWSPINPKTQTMPVSYP